MKIPLASTTFSFINPIMYKNGWKDWLFEHKVDLMNTKQVRWALDYDLKVEIKDFVDNNNFEMRLYAVADLSDIQITEFYLRF